MYGFRNFGLVWQLLHIHTHPLTTERLYCAHCAPFSNILISCNNVTTRAWFVPHLLPVFTQLKHKHSFTRAEYSPPSFKSVEISSSTIWKSDSLGSSSNSFARIHFFPVTAMCGWDGLQVSAKECWEPQSRRQTDVHSVQTIWRAHLTANCRLQQTTSLIALCSRRVLSDSRSQL